MTRTALFFTDSTGFGGAEQSLLNLLGGLDRERWRPVLVHHPASGLEPLLREARELDVTTMPVPAMLEGRQGAARVPGFVWQLRTMRTAVFHAHLTWPLACKYALFAAGLARVPAIVATEHCFVEMAYTRSMRLKQRVFAAGIHRYVAVSHTLASRLSQTFRIPAHKLRVVLNGIPSARFDRPANGVLRASLSGATQRPIILTIARLDGQKGQCYLLQAASRIPEALFVLAGDGPDRAGLEAQARELGVYNRIVFLGHRQDIPDLLAACDVFVLPSLWEGLPLSVLEAMAAGRPVIATEVDGTGEAVTHGETGLLVPPADPAALADAIRTILCDSQLARRLAAAGQSRARRDFSVETMVGRITDIYAELLDEHEARHAGH